MSSSEIYSGLASFGRAEVIIGGVISVIICIGLIIGGIAILTSKDNFIPVNGTVKICSINICSVEYTVGTINHTITMDSTNLKVGQTVKLEYDPTNPSNARPQSLATQKYVGWILMGIGCLILVVTFLSIYFAFKSKTYAAALGAAGAINMITGRGMYY